MPVITQSSPVRSSRLAAAFRRCLFLTIMLPGFLLAACGEDYVAVPYHGFPYDNERTAGTGVQYVLAKMLPQKGPVVETPAPVAPVIDNQADIIFDNRVRK